MFCVHWVCSIRSVVFKRSYTDLNPPGAAEDMALSSLRFGIGRFTTEAEIDFVVEKLVATVQRLRDMSPLWEMVQEGIDINTIDWSQH